MCNLIENSSLCGGVEGLVLLHFSSKDFEILDLDPPNNPTSHYGACHFGYNLALKGEWCYYFDIATKKLRFRLLLGT